MSRRARQRAAAVAAKHVSLCVPVEREDPEDPEDQDDDADYSAGPTCPHCGAGVAPGDDECWSCGLYL